MVSQTDGTLGRASREPLAESRAVRSPGNRQASGGHPKPRCTSGVPHAALPSRNSLLCLHSPAGLPGTGVATRVTVSLQGPSWSPWSLSIRDRCRGRTGTCDDALFPLPSAQSACARVGGAGRGPRAVHAARLDLEREGHGACSFSPGVLIRARPGRRPGLVSLAPWSLARGELPRVTTCVLPHELARQAWGHLEGGGPFGHRFTPSGPRRGYKAGGNPGNWKAAAWTSSPTKRRCQGKGRRCHCHTPRMACGGAALHGPG